MAENKPSVIHNQRANLTQRQKLWRWILRHVSNLNIRLKIIGPFLVLTLIIAVLGTYIVTRLVFTSLDDRLTNHAIDAGRVVSSNIAQQEVRHQESARLLAYTSGFREAIPQKDTKTLIELARPYAETNRLELILVTDLQGDVLVHALLENDVLTPINYPTNAQLASIIRTLLQERPITYESHRALGLHPVDGRYYYFTAIPVHNEEQSQMIGVLMVGTSLDMLMTQFKRNALADVTIYINRGQAIQSTLTSLLPGQESKSLLQDLSLSPDTYIERLETPEITYLDTYPIGELTYRFATGALYVENDALGVFSVALPTDYVFTAGKASRNSYFVIIFLTTVAIIIAGQFIAQQIIGPVKQLAATSRAVAEGNLDRRTGIESSDEIGVLASTFDYMTASLAKRNAELKESLRIQQELASRMRAILSSIGDGVILEDINGHIEPANKAAKKMLAELATKYKSSNYEPIHSLPAGHDWKQDIILDNPWLLESRRFQIADKVMSAHSATVETDDQERLGTAIVLRDITAEVEAEQLKDAFVEHVSHELRTPLTSIKGYSSLLLATAGESLNQQQRAFLQTIINQTENLTTMVNALLDFSEMQASGRLGLRKQPLAIQDLITELEAEWRPRLEEKDLTFTVDIAPDVPSIHGDPNRLRWALMNLIRNAYQYTETGSVTLTLTANHQNVIVDVTDTGIGVAPADQRRIFNRFQRVMNVQDDLVRGLGLGLYVTKAIIEGHEGSIHLDSELQSGSTFTIELPVLEANNTGDE